MVKTFAKRIGAAFITLLLVQVVAFAQSGSATEPQNVSQSSFQSRCDSEKLAEMKFPECANSTSECGSKYFVISAENETGRGAYRTPFNCLFLEEPIGGDTGLDLYKVTPMSTDNGVITGNNYELWHGEAIVPPSYGPVQAVLVFEPGREDQGPFGLLYNYLGLVYNFVSGIIVGFAVLVVIIGGIMISTAGGEPDKLNKGKDLIKKALIGMVLWFTASVILYTINPTFFTFI